MKVMFDINVVLDIIAMREPFFVDSQAAFLRVVKNGDEPYMAVHAVATLYYLLGGATTRANRESAMDWVLESFKVGTSGESDVKSARELAFPDFEDALVAASANSNGCSFILTRNGKDFQNSPVPILTPQAFLERSNRDET